MTNESRQSWRGLGDRRVHAVLAIVVCATVLLVVMQKRSDQTRRKADANRKSSEDHAPARTGMRATDEHPRSTHAFGERKELVTLVNDLRNAIRSRKYPEEYLPLLLRLRAMCEDDPPGSIDFVNRILMNSQEPEGLRIIAACLATRLAPRESANKLAEVATQHCDMLAAACTYFLTMATVSFSGASDEESYWRGLLSFDEFEAAFFAGYRQEYFRRKGVDVENPFLDDAVADFGSVFYSNLGIIGSGDPDRDGHLSRIVQAGVSLAARMRALQGLSNCENTNQLALSILNNRGENSRLRSMALERLKRVNRLSQPQVLEIILQDSEDGIRAAAVSALVIPKEPEAEIKVIHLLAREVASHSLQFPEFARSALQRIGAIDSVGSIAALSEIFRQVNTTAVRCACAQAVADWPAGSSTLGDRWTTLLGMLDTSTADSAVPVARSLYDLVRRADKQLRSIKGATATWESIRGRMTMFPVGSVLERAELDEIALEITRLLEQRVDRR